MFYDQPHPRPRVKNQKVFVSVSPSGLPIDLLSIQHKLIERQQLTIQDAETTLDLLDVEHGAALMLAQELADRLAVFAPDDPVLKTFEDFLGSGIDSTDC